MPVMCGFARHPLREGVLVEDPKYYSFIRKIRPDFRPDDQVCRVCRNSMEVMYELKRTKAKKLRDSRIAGVETVSSLSQSQSSADSFDALVDKTPLHKSMHRNSSRMQRTSDNEKSTESISALVQLLKSSQSSSDCENAQPNIVKSPAKQTKVPNTSVLQQSHQDMSPLLAFSSERLSDLSLDSSNAGNKSKPTKVTFADQPTTIDSGRVLTTPRNRLLDFTSRNDPIPSPTIYDDSTSDERYFRESLNVRISQEPSTSTAAAKAAAIQLEPAKKRVIKDFFQPTPKIARISKRSPVKATRKSNSPKVAHISQVSPAKAARKSNSPRAASAANTSVRRQSPRGQVINTSPLKAAEKPKSPTVRRSSSDDSPIKTAGRRTSLNRSGQRVPQRPVTADTSTEDNGEESDSEDVPLRSLNFYNPSVRLPHIQPIPRKRQFNHPDSRVMDIYIQGMTGG